MQTSTALAKRVERWLARITRESELAPSGFIEAPDARIDDGPQYGDPTKMDMRPDFVKADDRSHFGPVEDE